MIYSVRGTIAAKEYGLAVIECAGVGYACRTTAYSLAELGDTGTEGMLYTYLHVTQDDVVLFGFADKTELGCFKLLLTVSGVGPKAALSILSGMDAQNFALTVATGDFKTLSKIKGIGPKTAQRIVLELKDKIAKEQVQVSGSAPIQPAVKFSKASDEAVQALMVLGFSEREAEAAVASQDPSLSVEEIIKLSLKSLAR
ncbi:MAG: Holliday junction branch migration protein RuvA [Oscillospiraceae bacterium]|nr:Holliday junction branch migration protein RuvA [Oscillospiraceae bacterium]